MSRLPPGPETGLLYHRVLHRALRHFEARRMSMIFRTAAMLAGALTIACVGAPTEPRGASAEPAASISQASIRAELERHVCAVWLAEFAVYEPRFGDLHCAQRGAADESRAPVELAVARALEDTSDLVVLSSEAYDRAYAQLEAPQRPSPDAADSIVRAVYGSDAHLGPAALARAIHYVRVQGLACEGCVESRAGAPEVRTWDELRPYVGAYIWPSQADGEIQIHVCSANNGIEELGLTDAKLRELGFLSAVALAAVSSTSIELAAITEGELSLDEARAAIAELIDSQAARRLVCASAERHAWYTGVRIDECEEVIADENPE